ncbi:MAG: endonuclease V [Thermoplasmataceae archaeon]
MPESKTENIDFYDYLYKLLQQIPEGFVTTYGALASALGDIRASRAVGTMLSENESGDIYPCYKVVYSNGEVGNYTHPLGPAEKKRRLEADGVKISRNRIENFERSLFSDFKTDYPLRKLASMQDEMKSRVSLEDDLNGESIGAVDVSYEGRTGYGVFIWQNGNKLNKKEVVMSSNFPYIPGYLAFREYKFIKELCYDFDGTLLVDGNGILHPRGVGLATYAGLKLNIPTIGVAKSLLMGKVRENNVYLEEKKVAVVLSSNSIVSPGNRISLNTAVKIVRSDSAGTYPKILKLVHDETVSLRKNNLLHAEENGAT